MYSYCICYFNVFFSYCYWYECIAIVLLLNVLIVECYGYMGYKDDTNYWSACNVSDFTSYINRQHNFFVEELGESTPGPTRQATEGTTALPCTNKHRRGRKLAMRGYCKQAPFY